MVKPNNSSIDVRIEKLIEAFIESNNRKYYAKEFREDLLALLKSDHEEMIKRVEGLKKTIDEQALEILHRVELPNSPSEGNVRNKTLDEVVSLLKEGVE